jgi:hypothetical protein
MLPENEKIVQYEENRKIVVLRIKIQILLNGTL